MRILEESGIGTLSRMFNELEQAYQLWFNEATKTAEARKLAGALCPDFHTGETRGSGSELVRSSNAAVRLPPELILTGFPGIRFDVLL